MATRSAVFIVLVLALASGVGCGAGKEAAATVTVTVQAPAETVESEVPPATTVEDVETEAPAEAEDAVVVATKAGFGQDGSQLGYGMILRNMSKSDDALDVAVTVNVLDGQGNILSTESESVNVIPAGEVFYLGGSTSVPDGERADEVEPIIAVGSSEPASYPLPKVTRVRVLRTEFLGLEVRGEIENTLREPLSSFAKIGVVVFDPKGNIVGGGFTFPDGEIPPGRRVGFQATIGVSAASPASAKFARASIDNEVS